MKMSFVRVWVCASECVYVCVCKRERERERESGLAGLPVRKVSERRTVFDYRPTTSAGHRSTIDAPLVTPEILQLKITIRN